MGIAETSGTQVEESEIDPDSIDIDLRRHPASPLVLREGEGNHGAAPYAADGWDVDLHASGLDLVDAPTCGCRDAVVRNGVKRVVGVDGGVSLYGEPAPIKYWKQSPRQGPADALALPANVNDRRNAMTGMQLEVPAACYPLFVEPLIQLNWNFSPPDPDSLLGEIQVRTTLNGVAQATDTYLTTAYGSWASYALTPMVVEPGNSLLIQVDLKYRYNKAVLATVNGYIDRVQIGATVTEQTTTTREALEGC